MEKAEQLAGYAAASGAVPSPSAPSTPPGTKRSAAQRAADPRKAPAGLAPILQSAKVRAIAGVLAGQAGFVTWARAISGQAGMGVMCELDAIAPSVIGGISLFGGLALQLRSSLQM